MYEQETLNRRFYKSMVAGMCICLPLGLGFGIVQDNIILGLVAGNVLGIVLGIIISKK